MTSTTTRVPIPRAATEADLLGTGRVEAESDGNSRWYTHPITGEQYLSVTYVTGASQSKPWLTDWSARLAAQYAVEFLPAWLDLAAKDPEAAVKQIKGAAAASRELAADIGTYVHDVVEALFLGKPIPLIPDHLAGRTAEYDGERITVDQAWLDKLVDGFLNFVSDFGFVATAAECTVASDLHKGAGTIDAMGRLTKLDGEDGILTGLDTKTGAHLGREVLAQLGPYSRFEHVWLPGGQIARRPRLGRWAVLHIRASYRRGYKLLFVTPEELSLGWEWWQQCRRQLECAALTPERFGHALYPPLPDGSQPAPMVEDLRSYAGCSRAVKPLVAAGFEWMSEVAILDRADVQAIKGVGPKTVDALARVLGDYGLAFRGEQPAKVVA